MKQIINYSAVAISSMFIAVGCGGSGGGDGGPENGDGNSSTSQAEPAAPTATESATEFISLKVAGMT